MISVRKNRKKITLAGILLKIKYIADHHHNGQIGDNEFAIFNQLTTTEKRMFIRSAIIHLQRPTDRDSVRFLTKDRRSTDKPSTEVKNNSIEIEVINTKTWVFKLGAGLILVFLFLAILTSFFINREDGILTILQTFFKALKVAFG